MADLHVNYESVNDIPQRRQENLLDDGQYIVRLLGQVITVSLETMKVLKALPALGTGGTDDRI